MSQAQPKSAAQQSTRGRRGAILVLLSFAMLLVSLDQYIVVVALPEIARDLGYSAQTLQSVVSAYAIASSGFLSLVEEPPICSVDEGSAGEPLRIISVSSQGF